MKIPPTIFHITHWKAGSQWITEILKHCAPDRFVPWTVFNHQRLNIINFYFDSKGRGINNWFTTPLVPGKIYGTVYFPNTRFQKIISGKYFLFYPHRALRNWWNYRVKQYPYKNFVVIRDARDTLTSFYFSNKYSHSIVNNEDLLGMAQRRERLNELTEEDGLIYLLDDFMPKIADIQASWLGEQGVLYLKYEDIIGNEYAVFEQLIAYCEISISRERLRDIVRYNIFETVTGRKRGEEDSKAHLRKGISGDWHNHFTNRVKIEFKKRYGQLLIDTGYEKNFSW